MFSISAAIAASNKPSIILFPCTLTNGLGVFKVIGTSLLPNPAAKNTAVFTL